MKLYEKAVDAYKYALAIDEKFDYAYRNMGDAFIRLRKYKDAIESLERVLELSRPEDVIFEAMGYCWEKQKWRNCCLILLLPKRRRKKLCFQEISRK